MQKPFKFKQLALYGGLASTSVLVMAPASEAATITLDKSTLGAGPDQSLQLLINGTDQIGDAIVFAQINDGGAANEGTAAEPVITYIDFTTGIFASNYSSSSIVYQVPGSAPNYSWGTVPRGTPSLMAAADVNTASGTVPDNGNDGHTLATITLNTSTMTVGQTFTIKFFDVQNDQIPGNPGDNNDTEVDDSHGNPFALTGNGTYPYAETITIVNVPEPAAALLVIPSASLALFRRERRRSLHQV